MSISEKPGGSLRLQDIHDGQFTDPVLDEDEMNVLKVASGAILEPGLPISIGNNVFKVVHSVVTEPRYPYQTVSESIYNPSRLHFSVVESNSIDSHPKSAFAKKLITNLQTVNSPWIGLETTTRDILNKSLGFDFPPAVVAIVANENDFTREVGWHHGQFVSVLEPGIRIGKIGNRQDFVFTIIFGSKAWENGNGTYESPQAYFILQHELSHFLILVASRGNKLNKSLNLEYSIVQALGEPIWEGLADCISGRVDFISNEERWIREIRQYKPEKSLLDQQSRTLGGVPNYLNEILVANLLKTWRTNNGEVESSETSHYDSALAFLNSAFGLGPEEPENSQKGWLVKRIFMESGFDYEETVNHLKNLSQKEIEEIIFPLTPHSTQKGFRERLIREWKEYAPLWQPFGKDSLVS